LARAVDASHALREVLWREFAANLLSRRPLALASHLTLLDISDRLAMQFVLSLAGILAMIIVAMLLNRISVKHGHYPGWRQSTEKVAPAFSSWQVADGTRKEALDP
jgi:SNF family Na+-dependent transporter